MQNRLLGKSWEKKQIDFSYPELCRKVQGMLERYTAGSYLTGERTNRMVRNQEEYRRMISESIRSCCSGNPGAKDTVKELIYNYLVSELAIGEEQLDFLLPVGQAEQLSGSHMLEILLYEYETEANKGFLHLWEQKEFRKMSATGVITEEMLRSFYKTARPDVSTEGKFRILTQLIFADTLGLGVIDSLNQQQGCIEELQLGFNGYQERTYDYRNELKKEKRLFYGKDGVHVLVRGQMLWLKCLSFGTEEELQRVIRNLIRDAKAGELTRSNPNIVVDTVDGRRVSVSRPPMTDGWMALIRKFDTVYEVSLEKLYRKEENKETDDVLPKLIRNLVISGRNIAITGEMASGKTTLFRACLCEIKKDYNLRVIESESFEINVRNFLPEHNSMTMRISAATPAEEVLAFAKKTTGQIFAVGEVNSAAVAMITMDLSKFATQIFFSAHYISTEHMLADFLNAKLYAGGYSEEAMAQSDVLRCIGFDIHLKNRGGRRYVQYINEVVVTEGLSFEREKQYQIRKIYEYSEKENRGRLLAKPGKFTYERAKDMLKESEYEAFVSFFENEVQECET